jgi:hypothetical protein
MPPNLPEMISTPPLDEEVRSDEETRNEPADDLGQIVRTLPESVLPARRGPAEILTPGD